MTTKSESLKNWIEGLHSGKYASLGAAGKSIATSARFNKWSKKDVADVREKAEAYFNASAEKEVKKKAANKPSKKPSKKEAAAKRARPERKLGTQEKLSAYEALGRAEMHKALGSGSAEMHEVLGSGFATFSRAMTRIDVGILVSTMTSAHLTPSFRSKLEETFLRWLEQSEKEREVAEAAGKHGPSLLRSVAAAYPMTCASSPAQIEEEPPPATEGLTYVPDEEAAE
jgi:hypothetical protein